MKNTKKLILVGIVLFSGLFLSPHIACGEENNEALKQQVKELQQKVAQLEKALEEKSAVPYMADRIVKRTPWDPFAEMDRIQTEMNRLFQDSFFRGLGPRGFDQKTLLNPDLDIRETDTGYIAQLDLPGMNKADIDIEVKGQQVIISGEKKQESIEENEANNYYRKERSFGSFTRIFPLPENSDRASIDAKYEDGVLTINIAKLKPTKKTTSGTKIQVN